MTESKPFPVLWAFAGALAVAVILLVGLLIIALIVVGSGDHQNTDSHADQGNTGIPADSGQTGYRAYVCEYGQNAVAVFDPGTGDLLGEIVLDGNPSGVALSHDGKYVYVNDSSSIAVVDADTDQVIGHIATSHLTSGYLVVSPDDRRLYVVCKGGMSVIGLTGSGGSEAAFVPGTGAMGIGISSDGHYVYTTDWGLCQVLVFDTNAQVFDKPIDLIPPDVSHANITWQNMQVKAAGQSTGIGISPDGRHAVVGIWAGSFASVVDLQSQTLEKAVQLSSRSYQGVVFAPDGERVYIANYDGNRIIALDGTTFQQVDSFGTEDSPMNIAISPDGRYMLISYENGPVQIASLPYGRTTTTLGFEAAKNGMSLAFSPAHV